MPVQRDGEPLAEPIAALYDIHGHLPALDAALAAAEGAGARSVLVGGDVVLGPMPRETLHRLRTLHLPVQFIRGNCDRLVVDAYDAAPLPALPAAALDAIAATARLLSREERDFLAGFPMTQVSVVSGVGEVLFCHATPRSDEEILDADIAPERVMEMLDGATQRVIVCGHTHVQGEWTTNGVRFVNAGSVGMPVGPTGAQWVLLGPGISRMCTPF